MEMFVVIVFCSVKLHHNAYGDLGIITMKYNEDDITSNDATDNYGNCK